MLNRTDLELLAEERDESHSLLFVDKVEVITKEGKQVIRVDDESEVNVYFRGVVCSKEN